MSVSPKSGSSPTPNGSDDDLSTHLHRKVVGCLGASLPVALVLLGLWRPVPVLGDGILGSISAYYYSGGVAVFAGVLAALAVYLFTYRGYRNERNRQDRIAAVVAGLAAALVAAFPTGAPVDALRLPWWTREVGWVHYAAAAVLFSSFAYMSLVLFTKSDKPKEQWSSGKKFRNAVFRVCGVAIVCCILWIVLTKVTHRPWPIFWPEALALEFFAASWLVKGRADRTAVASTRWALQVARRPAQWVGRGRA